MCRFINADAFASTGQGFIGYNMFAYCNNNPILYADYGGQKLTIIDYYFIHLWVQLLCAAEYGFGIEVQIDSKLGKGRLDLYDPYNHTYYEVKSERQAKSWGLSYQYQKYRCASVVDELYPAAPQSPPQEGTKQISGSFTYREYNVSYELVAPGLIMYKPEPGIETEASYVIVKERSTNPEQALGYVAAIPFIPVIPAPGGFYYGSPNPLLPANR